MDDRLLSAAFAQHAVIPPPAESQRRTYRVVVHSGLRDRHRWPRSERFEVELPEPILDVAHVRIVDADLPKAAHVAAGRNTLELVETRVDTGAELSRTTIAIPPGDYSDPARLASALDVAVRSASSCASARAFWDPVGRRCRIVTDMRHWASGEMVRTHVAPPAGDGYPRSLARTLGFNGPGARPADQALVGTFALTRDSRDAATYRTPTPVQGADVGETVVLRVAGDLVSGTLEQPRVIRAPGLTLATATADIFRAEIVPDAAFSASKTPVLFLNGMRRLESPHDGCQAAFALVRGIHARADLARGFVPTIPMVQRVSVRLADETGDDYYAQSADYFLELEFESLRPGARLLPGAA